MANLCILWVNLKPQINNPIKLPINANQEVEKIRIRLLSQSDHNTRLCQVGLDTILQGDEKIIHPAIVSKLKKIFLSLRNIF
jgi:hypothetical protein